MPVATVASASHTYGASISVALTFSSGWDLAGKIDLLDACQAEQRKPPGQQCGHATGPAPGLAPPTVKVRHSNVAPEEEWHSEAHWVEPNSERFRPSQLRAADRALPWPAYREAGDRPAGLDAAHAELTRMSFATREERARQPLPLCQNRSARES